MSDASPALTPDSLVSRSSGSLSAEVASETVLMSVERGSYFGLAATGREIWRRLEQPVRVRDLCAALCSDYEGEPGRIEAETLAFLERMAAAGLVQVA
jgi:hypothetical protein